MKNKKFYAISLLLSFLVILSHDMIPHHHHDEQYTHQKSADHYHHEADHQKHNHSNDPEKEHNHTIPFHHHIFPTNDFDYLRIELIRNIVFNFPLLTVLNSYSDTSLSEPPELDFIRFTEKPFLITSIFEPGAIGLRAPPSIA